jgi:hypothetical protein
MNIIPLPSTGYLDGRESAEAFGRKYAHLLDTKGELYNAILWISADGDDYEDYWLRGFCTLIQERLNPDAF